MLRRTTQCANVVWLDLDELFEDLIDAERRRVVHILAALREHIADELDYDPEDPTDPRSWPLTTEQWREDHGVVYQALTALMAVAHADEAGEVDARIAAWRQANMREEIP